MKNYLGNLIARHTNQAEVLLPRLASRFEPQSSVLQSDEFQVETAEFDLAETLGVESDAVQRDAVEHDAIERNALERDAVARHVIERDAVKRDAVAPVSPIPPEIAHRVANPSLPLSHSPESVVESSGPVPVTAFAVANDQNESRSVPPADSALPNPNEIAINSRLTTTPQPFTANEPLTTIEPVIVNQPVTASEHEHGAEIERVTENEPITRAVRAAALKHTQPATQWSIETQRAISPPATATETETETESETANPAASRESLAPTIKRGPVASGTKGELLTFVSKPEDDISLNLPKLQQSDSRQTKSPVEIEHSSREQSSLDHSSRELLSTVVVPERTENSPLVNASSASQTAPKQPETLPEEAHLSQVAQRARQLETSVAKSHVNNLRNVINPKNTRLMPHYDSTPAEAGPIINVTIGRIEVRAATAEPQPQKQRREQQVLSLDEYLNQRSAGGR